MKTEIKLIRNTLIYTLLILAMACKKDIKKNQRSEAVSEMEGEQVESTIELLVGTYSDEESKGIYKYNFNPATGTLSDKILLAEQTSPTFLCISKDRSTVYSVNRPDPATTAIYKWNEDRTALNLQSTHLVEGEGPCNVVLNEAENLLAVANYSSGNIAVYPLDSNGAISGGTQTRQHSGTGPILPNQESPRAHCALFDASGRFLYISDLGIDKVLQYPIDSEGNLQVPQVAFAADPGDGPRLLISHPNKNQVFMINELSSSVVSARVDKETGTFTRIDKQSTLPPDFKDKNSCADIRLSNDGRFLYASNRGHNSIAIFSVTEEGKLSLLRNEPVQGDWPRNFTLSPDGEFLLVANRKSNNIVVFKVNKKSGMLTYSENQASISQPVCLVF